MKNIKNPQGIGPIKPKRQKHNYTSELELKSLLIRIKNKHLDLRTDERLNSRINKYVKLFVAIDRNKNTNTSAQKRKLVKARIKQRIIDLSVMTCVDAPSYERFGVIILLMIKRLLTKPNFSSYTYQNDFYSDATYKILKYLHNFKYDKISKITGRQVDAFAYISQIMHNSILHIINSKKRDQEKMKSLEATERYNYDFDILNYDWSENSTYEVPKGWKGNIVKHNYLSISESANPTLIQEIKDKTKAGEKTLIYRDGSLEFECDKINKLKETQGNQGN